MRKFIPIAAALTIVALFAAAILASGEVLSFSAPGVADSVDRAPADQAQPQDFAGAGSQFYYFGPDFMCQIFSDSTIGCFGSDTDNIVSNVPTETGFTNIDGGDTYACAFHQASRFNYCWGSINLRPTTSQPTATSEPTATPEPTATTVSGDDTTPEPSATSAPATTATPVPDPCRISLPSNSALPFTVTGSWSEDCEYPYELEDVADGDRYYKWIVFAVTNPMTSWIATLESEEDTVLVLWKWDAENEQWDFVEQNDDLAQGNTNSRIEWTPTQGSTYSLLMTTYPANTLGDFTLTIEEGASSGQSSMTDQRMEHPDLPANMPFERRQ